MNCQKCHANLYHPGLCASCSSIARTQRPADPLVQCQSSLHFLGPKSQPVLPAILREIPHKPILSQRILPMKSQFSIIFHHQQKIQQQNHENSAIIDVFTKFSHEITKKSSATFPQLPVQFPEVALNGCTALRNSGYGEEGHGAGTAGNHSSNCARTGSSYTFFSSIRSLPFFGIFGGTSLIYILDILVSVCAPRIPKRILPHHR